MGNFSVRLQLSHDGNDANDDDWLAAASSEQLRAVAGIRYGNFQFGQNLRIYPARGWYRVQDMYYARGGGGWHPRRAEKKKKEKQKKGGGKDEREGHATEEGRRGGVCV